MLASLVAIGFALAMLVIIRRSANSQAPRKVEYFWLTATLAISLPIGTFLVGPIVGAALVLLDYVVMGITATTFAALAIALYPAARAELRKARRVIMLEENTDDTPR